jgi:hypothetical protein
VDRSCRERRDCSPDPLLNEALDADSLQGADSLRGWCWPWERAYPRITSCVDS